MAGYPRKVGRSRSWGKEWDGSCKAGARTGTPKYRLRELQRDGGAGGPLVALGVIAIAGSMIYDFLHGIQVIETKRDRVRFKYGKRLKLQAGARTGTPSVALSYAF